MNDIFLHMVYALQLRAHTLLLIMTFESLVSVSYDTSYLHFHTQCLLHTDIPHTLKVNQSFSTPN